MMGKEDIKKLATKLWRHQHGMRTYSIMHPERDWLIGVFLIILLVILVAVWSATTYQRNRAAINVDSKTEVETPIVYRGSMVEEALAIFSEREEVVNSILTETRETMTETNPATTTEETSATTTEPQIEDVEIDTETASDTPLLAD